MKVLLVDCRDSGRVISVSIDEREMREYVQRVDLLITLAIVDQLERVCHSTKKGVTWVNIRRLEALSHELDKRCILFHLMLPYRFDITVFQAASAELALNS